MEVLLHAIANEGLDAIKLEIDLIGKSLERAINLGYVKIKQVNNANYNSLSNELLRSPEITMLHYSGHSITDGLQVNLDGEKGILGIDSLLTLISTHKKIKFVFLNSCYSENLAREFVKIGVPYVIGTEGRVGDKDSAFVAKMFYHYLAFGTKTISDSFLLTREFFVHNEGELSIIFRSLITTKDKGKNIWKLFPEDHNKLQNDQKDWTLIPKDKLILSDPANEDKTKIFCIYGDDENSIEFFKKIKFYQENFQVNRVVNGTLNISENFNKASFLNEYNKANIVINLITKESVEFIKSNNIIDLTENFKNKKHCYMPIFESDAIIKNTPWIDNNFILKPEPEMHIRISGLDFSNEKRPNNFDENFGAFHEQKFEKILKSNLEVNVSITLKDTLIDIPVSQFNKNSYKKIGKLLYYSIIEGSSDCGLKLITNKFKKSILDENSLKVLLTFQKKIPYENLIEDLNAFWRLLYYELKQRVGLKNIRENDTDKFATECFDIIDGQIIHSDVFIIFDDINKDLHNSIINSFWSKITEEFEKNAGTEYLGKLYVFTLNNNLLDETQKLVTFNTIFSSFEPINYSPLNPLTEEEFRTNWPNLVLFPKLSSMNYQDILDDGQPPKRLKAIKYICEKADENLLYHEIFEILNN